jgi:hypothetical protein
MGAEDSRVIGGRPIHYVSDGHGDDMLEMGGDQRILEATVEAVNVTHITSNTMEDLEMVAKEFLCPPSNLVNGFVVFKDFLHGTTIAKPIELRPPEKLLILADAPAASPTKE